MFNRCIFPSCKSRSCRKITPISASGYRNHFDLYLADAYINLSYIFANSLLINMFVSLKMIVKYVFLSSFLELYIYTVQQKGITRKPYS